MWHKRNRRVLRTGTGSPAPVLAGLLLALAAAAPGMAADPAPVAAVPAQAAAQAQPPLEGHARVLAQKLELTDQQQAKLARILVERREAIRQVWQDAHVPAELRNSATRAINAKTEDQIRAILTDEQKKKYVATPPKAPSDSKSELDRWFGGAAAK